MTTPIVLSLGELLWDMLPSGKKPAAPPSTSPTTR